MPAKARRLVHPFFLSGEEWEMREYAARPTRRRPARRLPPPTPKPARPLAARGHRFRFVPPWGWVNRLRTAGPVLRAFRAAAASGPNLVAVPVRRLLAYRTWLLAWDNPVLLATVGTDLASAPVRVLLAAL